MKLLFLTGLAALSFGLIGCSQNLPEVNAEAVQQPSAAADSSSEAESQAINVKAPESSNGTQKPAPVGSSGAAKMISPLTQ